MADGVAMIEPVTGRRVFVANRDREEWTKNGYVLAEREPADEAAKVAPPADENEEAPPENEECADETEDAPAENAPAVEDAPRQGGVTTPRRASRDRTF